nr:ribonuclease H-like domain-containing protein [Tanacetum cinerariifolium]
MKMEHYLSHTDYPIWQVIQNGNGLVSVITDTNGMIKFLPPKTAKEVVAIERERKARTTLLMTLPEDHLAKFHKMADAKEMWEAIKSRFVGNDESKKMQKYLLKQQFEGFSVSASEGLHKGYDRFETLLSQLEIHGAGVSHEDANQKFLRSLPSSWSQVALIMRTKPGLDTLSFDDLYNNLRVFERDVKGTTTSSSSDTHNVAFVSADNITNDINDDDMEEIDLKWQNYAMMAYSSSNSGSDNEIKSCSKTCEESYARLRKLDAYEKKLIQVLEIHTDDNVADLLTKAFDVSSKELASPKQMTLEQMAAGKENSNPLMADSLPITTLLTMLDVKLLLFMEYA